MSMPTEYPVTMIDQAGHEYQVFNASGFVNAVYAQGHRVKPAKVADPVKPAAAAPAAAPAAAAPAAPAKPEPVTAKPEPVKPVEPAK